MKRKKIALILFILILAIPIILLLYFRDTKNVVETKLDNASVRMKWFYSGTMTGWFAGKELGIFKNNGINLTINSGGPDNSSIKLVAAGSDLFGVAGADEVLIAREKGIPIVPIAVIFKESPIGFISKTNSNIRSPKDWAGKTMEVDYGSNTEIQYRALVNKFDVKNIKEVPYTYSLIPFIENKVDASVAYIMDQVVTLKNKGIELNIITAKEYGINPYADVLITTEKTLKEYPELVRRFIKATIESQRWAIENPDKAVDCLIVNAPNLKKENEMQVWNATIPFILADEGIESIGVMEQERWEQTQNILLEFHSISKKQNIDFKNLTQ